MDIVAAADLACPVFQDEGDCSQAVLGWQGYAQVAQRRYVKPVWLHRQRAFLRDCLSAEPIHKVKQIKAPLMVIQGANDPRVPQHESEQVVKALKKRKLPVVYLLYEDEGHGLAKLKNKLDAYPKMAEFLLEHLGVE